MQLVAILYYAADNPFRFAEQSFASRFFKTIVESIPQRVPPRKPSIFFFFPVKTTTGFFLECCLGPLATQLQPAEPWHIIWHEYERYEGSTPKLFLEVSVGVLGRAFDPKRKDSVPIKYLPSQGWL